MTIQKGKIDGFGGSWGSGIATLGIITEGHLKLIHCDNATTVRSLEGAFGNVITAGHCLDVSKIKGREIYFSTNDFGLLEGFVPVEEATPEIIEEYEKGKK